MTLLAILTLVAMESAVIVWAVWTGHEAQRLRGFAVGFNMVVIALFAPALIDVGFGVTNVGCIFYAAVVCGQALMLHAHGVDSARRTVPMASGAVAVVIALCWCLELFPVVPGNEPYMAALHTITARSQDVVVASFVALILSQEAMWRTWRRVQSRHGLVGTYLISAIVCQAVDSPLFFSIAFVRSLPIERVVEMATTGFLFKALLTVAFIPALLIANRRFCGLKS